MELQQNLPQHTFYKKMTLWSKKNRFILDGVGNNIIRIRVSKYL